jgi:hypothetical protein
MDTDIIWRTIPEYPTYEASSHGQIRGRGKADPLSQFLVGAGYAMVHLGQNKCLVSRTVASAFLPQPTSSKCIAAHFDNNKLNNHISNLSWRTRSQNTKDAHDTGAIKNKVRAVQQFTLNGELVAEYKAVTDAALAVGVRPGNISKCCRGTAKSTGGFTFKYTVDTDEKCVDLPGEEWRDVVTNSRYEVSNKGRVRHKARKRLRAPTGSTGYFLVGIPNRKDKKVAMCKVSRMVAEAFLPNPGNLPIVDHIDENKLNDVLENLRWSTASDNTTHSIGIPVIKLFPKTKTAASEFKSLAAAAKDANGCISSIREAIDKRRLFKGFYYIKKWIGNPSDRTVVDMDCSS